MALSTNDKIRESFTYVNNTSIKLEIKTGAQSAPDEVTLNSRLNKAFTDTPKLKAIYI